MVLLAVAACVVTIVPAMGQTVRWPAVLMRCVLELVRALPLGR